MMRRHLTSSIKSKPCGWTLRITVTGELDLLTSIRLRSHFDQALPSTKAIELDLREVAFMDSAGVQLLAYMRGPAGRRLRVIPSPAVARTVHLAARG